jgi:hypothetical protein
LTPVDLRDSNAVNPPSLERRLRELTSEWIAP